MNCAYHREIAATAFCRTCDKPLCQSCQRPAQGTVFCDEHAVVQAASPAAGYSPYASPYVAQTVAGGISPGLAFLLGLIPGVGAIYNGQYAKGLIHVVVFGLLLSINGSDVGRGELEPLFVLMVPTWIFYMAFEAYHTARRRMAGQSVDEFSSLIPLRQGSGFPVGPVLMIAVGLLFLLHNMEIIRIGQLLRYWPVFLIA